MMSNSKPNMLEAALAYAKKGYKVFPCCWPDENGKCACGRNHKKDKAGKVPLTLHGLSNASSEPKKIKKWWTKWPNANIGMSTTGNVVADFDMGKGGTNSRAALEAKYGALPLTLTHRTGGGGLHYIYDNSDGRKVTSVNGLRDGVDRKADGGYIIMPPSLYSSQNRYKALNEENIAPAPKWLMELSKNKKSSSSKEDDSWYIKALEGVGEGERNETATRLTGRWAGKGLAQEEIWLALSAWNLKNSPPMDENELRTTMESIYSTENAIIEHPALINMEEVEIRDVEYLWYPYIPLGKITLIDGDPGEAKSWFALAVAAKVSLGEYDRKPANVIVASLEDDEDDCMKPRLEDLGADMKRIKSIDKNFPLMLNEKGLQVFEEYIKETHAELLILDPILGYMAEADMHRANEMRAITSQLRRIASENNCSIVGIRHLTKPGKGLSGKAIYRGLGSIDLIAAARSGLLVGHEEDEDGTLMGRGMTHIKSNYAALGDSVGFEIESYGRRGFFQWSISTSIVTSKGMLNITKKGSKTDEARKWLKEFLADGKPRLSTEMYEAAEGYDISEGTLDRAKKSLRVKSIKDGALWYWSLPKKEKAGQVVGV